MSSDTTRKAIQDAVLEVRDYARTAGTMAPPRRDWRAFADGLAPVSVPVEERPQYREVYRIAAEHAAALLASFH